jgi:hypothetical protein
MKRLMTRVFVGALLVTGAITLDPPPAAADASGCSFTAGGGAGRRYDDNTGEEILACNALGSGCYECAYSHTSQSGWDLCVETYGAMACQPVQLFPSWWPDPDYTDHGEPGDGPPPGDNPAGTGGGDDGGGSDPGGGGGYGGGGCGGEDCFYGAHPRHYGKLVPKHSGYHP